MKKIITFLIISTFALLSSAQSENTGVIHGAVVDQNGNPLVGAMVTATGGAETTLVESDGTFSLEVPIWLKSVTASYAGYANKKMKTKFDKDMIFRLSPKQKYGFLNLSGGLHLDYGFGDSGFMLGLMGGILNNWGFYGKIMLPISNMDQLTLINVTAGVTKRIYKNLYGYLGIGYGGVGFYDYYSDYYTGYLKLYSYAGFAADLGFIYKIGRHFDVTVGYGMTWDFYDMYNNLPSISLGYVF